MDAVRKIVFVVGVIALLIVWKSYFPQTWDMFWATLDSLLTAQ